MSDTTIDKTTKINLGILGVLLSTAIGGAVYLTHLEGTLGNVVEQLRDLKNAMDRNTAQVAADGKVLAVVQAQVISLEKRVEILEGKLK